MKFPIGSKFGIWLCTIFFYCVGSLQAQKVEEYFIDRTWAFYNANVQNYLNSELAGALYYDFDNHYVEQKLGANSYVFHHFGNIHIESLGEVDFTKPVNKKWYTLNFESGDTANMAEVMLYLGNKNKIYFSSKEATLAILDSQIDSIVNHHKLKESTRLQLQENWYYNFEKQKLVSFLSGVGLFSVTEPSDSPVLWIDLRYFESDVFQRIRIINPDSSKINLGEFLKSRPFVLENNERGYSMYQGQQVFDPWNNEIEAYYELKNFNNDFEITAFKLKKNKPAKSKTMTGQLLGGKPHGLWKYSNKKGELRAEFTFENGVANGSYKLYDQSGYMAESGSFKDNKKHGEIVANYKEGTVRSIKNYNMGIPSATHILYYSNGVVYSKYAFENGKLNGNYTENYRDGRPRYQGRFKDGYIIGHWEYNLRLEDLLCNFLKEQYASMTGFDKMSLESLDDCVSSFSYVFTHKTDGSCATSMCIDLQMIGKFR